MAGPVHCLMLGGTQSSGRDSILGHDTWKPRALRTSCLSGHTKSARCFSIDKSHPICLLPTFKKSLLVGRQLQTEAALYPWRIWCRERPEPGQIAWWAAAEGLPHWAATDAVFPKHQVDVSLSFPRKSNFVFNIESRPLLEEVLDKLGKMF